MLVKHYPTLSNIVGRNIFDPFEHAVQSNLLDSVGRCWMKFDSGLFPRSKACHNFMSGTEIQHSWMVLDSFEHSSIQHNPTLIKHCLTPPNNIGCLTNMFDPFEWAY